MERLRARLGSGDPPSLGEFLEALADAADAADLVPAGRALAEEERREALARAESAWFRRMGWRVMRPMLAVGILAAAFFAFGQESIDPATGFGIFLLGAGSFYVVLQVYLHRWARAGRRRLEEDRRALRARLRQLASPRDA